jgi:hypothetical protein
MYKALYVAALLVVTFTLVSGSSSTETAAATTPVVVAKGRVLNQSNPIPQTTIFTPTHTGLYRVSVYLTVVKTCPSNCNNWYYQFYWTDDAGAQLSNGYLLSWSGFGSYATNGAGFGGTVASFEAVAGSPVSFATVGIPDGSIYSLYYTIERLE